MYPLAFYVILCYTIRDAIKIVKAQGGSSMKVELPMFHNAFYVRNTRKEHLSCLDGLPQGSNMDFYDYEFDKDGAITVIHKKVHLYNLTK